MSDALAVLGERYTFAALRELLYGNHRFSDLARLTGAPRSLLTARLRKLERAGVVVRRQYSDRPPRFEYLPTEAGADLLPVILSLKEWGERHATDGPPIAVFQHTCGAELHPVTVCAACREDVEDFVVVGGTAPPVVRSASASGVPVQP